MSLAQDDIDQIVEDIEATLDTRGLVLEGQTVADAVAVVARHMHSRMQRALRDRYRTLPSPLGDDLLTLLTTGCMWRMTLLGFINLPDSESEWPDALRTEFEGDLAALAAGVDKLATPVDKRKTCATSGEQRRFSADGMARVFR